MRKGIATRRIQVEMEFWESVVSIVVVDLFSFGGGLYASKSSVRDPGRKSVKHKSYNGCWLGTHFVQRLPKKAAETKVPRMPPLGKNREICIPNSDDPAIARVAPVVGCNESWVNDFVVCRDALISFVYSCRYRRAPNRMVSEVGEGDWDRGSR